MLNSTFCFIKKYLSIHVDIERRCNEVCEHKLGAACSLSEDANDFLDLCMPLEFWPLSAPVTFENIIERLSQILFNCI